MYGGVFGIQSGPMGMDPKLNPELSPEALEEMFAVMSGIEIKLDWRGYFEAFNQEHHGSPVEHNGKLLYRDGWTYAMQYEGPEFPPPSDPMMLHHLLLIYWSKRRKAVKLRTFNLETQLNEVKAAQMRRKVPLRQIVLAGSETARDGSVKMLYESRTVNLERYEMKLGHFKDDLDECEEHMARLLNKPRPRKWRDDRNQDINANGAANIT